MRRGARRPAGPLVACAVIAGALAACSERVPVRLHIHDACNQRVLADARVLEVEVTAAELERPVRESWPAAGHAGGMELPLVRDATLVVGAWSGDGGPPFAAGAAGLLSFLGPASRAVDVDLTLGRVDTFATTTGADGACVALASGRHDHTATALPDGRVLLAGGETSSPTMSTTWSTSELYEPASGSFVPGPDLGSWRRAGHASTLLANGQVLLTGGIDESQRPAETWRLGQLVDPVTTTVVGEVAMKSRRAHHTATLLDDGRVLVAGGAADGVELATTELFDPGTGKFAPGPPLLAPRARHAAVKVAPRSVALIGGSAAGAALASIELVLLDAGQVVPGPTLAVAREGPAAEVLPGADAIVVVGGFTAPALDPAQGEGVAAVEIVQLGRPLETTSRVVCAGLTLSVPRGAPALALVPGGLLVLGGVTAPGSVTGSVERVIASDLAHCIVSVTPAAATLVMPRAMARVATLAGGDVLVTGGFDLVGGRTHSLTDAEIYVRPR